MIRTDLVKKTSRLTGKMFNFIPHKLSKFRPYSHISKRLISENTFATALLNKLNSVTKQFDGVLGISEVRSAQSLVQTAEEEFMRSRRLVQETRTELVRLQNELKELRSKLDRIPREDERYLQLATEEHTVLIAERKGKTELEALETLERDQFAALSGAVRAAHEKERSRAERTKYWSIIGSACGAVIGILGSTIGNLRRMRQVRVTVEENNEAFIAKTMEELRTLLKPQAESKSTSHISNDLFAILNENKNTLNAIDAKIEKLSNKEYFALNLEHSQKSSFDHMPSSIELDKQIENIAWWSKFSLIATLSSSACVIFYIFSK